MGSRGRHRRSAGASRSTQFLGIAALTLAFAPAALARTFYVSPHGHDHSSGRSTRHPWRTVFRVDKAHLKPGDTVLFRGGATFSDDTLMPGWGLHVSGRRNAPVVFGSYGHGQATLLKGVWFKGESGLTFQNLHIGPEQGVNATGSYIGLAHCTFSGLTGGVKIAVNVIGSHWLIAANSITRTADSGMLLRGDHFLVAGNTITHTGLDRSLGYGAHGIYLEASDSTVANNRIVDFHDDGISVRYRNSVVTNNYIAAGRFGIAWFQYDRRTGTSRWTQNTIVNSVVAGIYVSPGDIGGATDENFVIRHNTIFRPAGRGAHVASGWRPISLSANKARYMVSANRVMPARR
jgi:parallel beta-helix repeat protein